jgi:hypothetical protein
MTYLKLFWLILIFILLKTIWMVYPLAIVALIGLIMLGGIVWWVISLAGSMGW